MVPLIRQITSRKSNERSHPIQQSIISLHWMSEFWNFTCLLCGYICLKIYPVPQPGTGYGSAMSGGLVSGSVSDPVGMNGKNGRYNQPTQNTRLL